MLEGQPMSCVLASVCAGSLAVKIGSKVHPIADVSI